MGGDVDVHVDTDVDVDDADVDANEGGYECGHDVLVAVASVLEILVMMTRMMMVMYVRKYVHFESQK